MRLRTAATPAITNAALAKIALLFVCPAGNLIYFRNRAVPAAAFQTCTMNLTGPA